MLLGDMAFQDVSGVGSRQLLSHVQEAPRDSLSAVAFMAFGTFVRLLGIVRSHMTQKMLIATVRSAAARDGALVPLQR